MPTSNLSRVISINEALKSLRDIYEDRRKNNPKLPANLNKEKLEQGIIHYDDLTGHKGNGIAIVSHKHISTSQLNIEKKLRVGATVTAIAASGAAFASLLDSGKKLLSATIGNGNLDDAYHSVGNAMSIGAIAGIANSASHENWNWGIGSAGMGIFGRFLDKPWGLALFSMFDGLNALGMGEVNCRDKKNITAMPNSIFNYPKLKFLSFLQPHEQAVKSFWTRFTSIKGWKKIFTDEPYAIFQSAAGGLFSGSALLGTASVFSSKMSDSMKSLCYLPYSLTSLVNIIALGRDGMIGKKRASIIDGRKPAETALMKAEGWFKSIAAPILGLNYGLLGLNSIGLKLNGMAEHLAMAMRTFGVGIAYLGFASQSGIKFAVPDMFGPKFKEVLKIIINPKIIMKKFKEMIAGVNAKKEELPKHDSDTFEPVINNDKFGELLNRVSNTKKFKRLKYRSLTGLPNEAALDRALLNRYIHSRRVGAIGVMFFNSLLKNTTDSALSGLTDSALSSLLEDEDTEAGFKLACLSHDNGHEPLPRSHLAETAIHGLDNDELSYAGLCEGSEIYDEVVKYYTEKYEQTIKNNPEMTKEYIKKYGKEGGKAQAEVVLEIAKKVIGHKHELSKVYKWADFCEYGRANGSDYSSSFNFPTWEKEDYQHFADQRILFKDSNGKTQAGFTEEGAVLAFKQIYYRLIFNAILNYHPRVLAAEAAYKAGIQNANITQKQVFGMTEDQFDDTAVKGANDFKSSSRIKIRNVLGGEKAYCGYSPKEKIYVVTKDQNGNQKVTEFTEHLEKIIKQKDSDLYKTIKPMADILTTPTLIELDITIDPDALMNEENDEPIILKFNQPQSRASKEEALAEETLRRTG